MKNQIGQFIKLIYEKLHRSLACNTKLNPREHIKAITLRNGEVRMERKQDEEEPVVEKDKEKEKVIEHFSPIW